MNKGTLARRFECGGARPLRDPLYDGKISCSLATRTSAGLAVVRPYGSGQLDLEQTCVCVSVWRVHFLVHVIGIAAPATKENQLDCHHCSSALSRLLTLRIVEGKSLEDVFAVCRRRKAVSSRGKERVTSELASW